jgi:hypothetical protein
MSEEPDVIRGLRLQALACRSMGSSLTAALLEQAADDAAAGGPAAALIAPWADDDLKRQFGEAVALRLAAAIQNLALEGVEADLAAAYEALDPERIWKAARSAMPRHRARLARFMEHEPQTNEVRRCIALLGGFLEVAARTGLPLRCFEVAASAGLNTSWDKYRYELAGAAWGDPASKVRIDTDWQGGLPPLDAPVEVIERHACDRRPTDLTDPVERRRLLSYYWPDQTERIARIRAAIDHTVATGLRVEAADAVDWVRKRVRLKPGAATVVYHSVVWSYLSPEARAGFTAAMENLGAQATAEAPFAWLSKEPATDHYTVMDVRLRLWPGGEDRQLAQCAPHAAWVKWLGWGSA